MPRPVCRVNIRVPGMAVIESGQGLNGGGGPGGGGTDAFISVTVRFLPEPQVSVALQQTQFARAAGEALNFTLPIPIGGPVCDRPRARRVCRIPSARRACMGLVAGGRTPMSAAHRFRVFIDLRRLRENLARA